MSNILNTLLVPVQYKIYILEAIRGMSQFNFIKKIYLFGSCARGSIKPYSDVDLLIITDEKLSDFVICNQILEVLPEMHGSTLYSDTIFLSEDEVQNNINTLGHISRVTIKGGIDLSGLLQECRVQGKSIANTITLWKLEK